MVTKPWMQKEEYRNAADTTCILDRWQRGEVFRASQLAIGWTETYVQYFDHISENDISYNAPYRQHEYGKIALSTREALIPIKKQDHCVNDLVINHQLLSAFNKLKAKEYLTFHQQSEQDKNDTVDPAVRQHPEWLSFHWPGLEVVEFLHLGTINGKTGTLKDGKTKNCGINNNDDNATIFDFYLHEETCAKTSAARS